MGLIRIHVHTHNLHITQSRFCTYYNNNYLCNYCILINVTYVLQVHLVVYMEML